MRNEKMIVVRSIRLRPDQYIQHWDNYDIPHRSGHIRDMLDLANQAEDFEYQIHHLERELRAPRQCRETLQELLETLRKEKSKGGTHFNLIELMLLVKDLIDALEVGRHPVVASVVAKHGATSSQGHQVIVKCDKFSPLEE